MADSNVGQTSRDVRVDRDDAFTTTPANDLATLTTPPKNGKATPPRSGNTGGETIPAKNSKDAKVHADSGHIRTRSATPHKPIGAGGTQLARNKTEGATSSTNKSTEGHQVATSAKTSLAGSTVSSQKNGSVAHTSGTIRSGAAVFAAARSPLPRNRPTAGSSTTAPAKTDAKTPATPPAKTDAKTPATPPAKTDANTPASTAAKQNANSVQAHRTGGRATPARNQSPAPSIAELRSRALAADAKLLEAENAWRPAANRVIAASASLMSLGVPQYTKEFNDAVANYNPKEAALHQAMNESRDAWLAVPLDNKKQGKKGSNDSPEYIANLEEHTKVGDKHNDLRKIMRDASDAISAGNRAIKSVALRALGNAAFKLPADVLAAAKQGSSKPSESQAFTNLTAARSDYALANKKVADAEKAVDQIAKAKKPDPKAKAKAQEELVAAKQEAVVAGKALGEAETAYDDAKSNNGEIDTQKELGAASKRFEDADGAAAAAEQRVIKTRGDQTARAESEAAGKDAAKAAVGLINAARAHMGAARLDSLKQGELGTTPAEEELQKLRDNYKNASKAVEDAKTAFAKDNDAINAQKALVAAEETYNNARKTFLENQGDYKNFDTNKKAMDNAGKALDAAQTAFTENPKKKALDEAIRNVAVATEEINKAEHASSGAPSPDKVRARLSEALDRLANVKLRRYVPAEMIDEHAKPNGLAAIIIIQQWRNQYGLVNEQIRRLESDDPVDLNALSIRKTMARLLLKPFLNAAMSCELRLYQAAVQAALTEGANSEAFKDAKAQWMSAWGVVQGIKAEIDRQNKSQDIPSDAPKSEGSATPTLASGGDKSPASLPERVAKGDISITDAKPLTGNSAAPSSRSVAVNDTSTPSQTGAIRKARDTIDGALNNVDQLLSQNSDLTTLLGHAKSDMAAVWKGLDNQIAATGKSGAVTSANNPTRNAIANTSTPANPETKPSGAKKSNESANKASDTASTGASGAQTDDEVLILIPDVSDPQAAPPSTDYDIAEVHRFDWPVSGLSGKAAQAYNEAVGTLHLVWMQRDMLKTALDNAGELSGSVNFLLAGRTDGRPQIAKLPKTERDEYLNKVVGYSRIRIGNFDAIHTSLLALMAEDNVTKWQAAVDATKNSNNPLVKARCEVGLKQALAIRDHIIPTGQWEGFDNVVRPFMVQVYKGFGLKDEYKPYHVEIPDAAILTSEQALQLDVDKDLLLSARHHYPVNATQEGNQFNRALQKANELKAGLVSLIKDKDADPAQAKAAKGELLEAIKEVADNANAYTKAYPHDPVVAQDVRNGWNDIIRGLNNLNVTAPNAVTEPIKANQVSDQVKTARISFDEAAREATTLINELHYSIVPLKKYNKEKEHANYALAQERAKNELKPLIDKANAAAAELLKANPDDKRAQEDVARYVKFVQAHIKGGEFTWPSVESSSENAQNSVSDSLPATTGQENGARKIEVAAPAPGAPAQAPSSGPVSAPTPVTAQPSSRPGPAIGVPLSPADFVKAFRKPAVTAPSGGAGQASGSGKVAPSAPVTSNAANTAPTPTAAVSASAVPVQTSAAPANTNALGLNEHVTVTPKTTSPYVIDVAPNAAVVVATNPKTHESHIMYVTSKDSLNSAPFASVLKKIKNDRKVNYDFISYYNGSEELGDGITYAVSGLKNGNAARASAMRLRTNSRLTISGNGNVDVDDPLNHNRQSINPDIGYVISDDPKELLPERKKITARWSTEGVAVTGVGNGQMGVLILDPAKLIDPKTNQADPNIANSKVQEFVRKFGADGKFKIMSRQEDQTLDWNGTVATEIYNTKKVSNPDKPIPVDDIKKFHVGRDKGYRPVILTVDLVPKKRENEEETITIEPSDGFR